MALPVHQQGQVAELPADQAPVGQVADGAQVMPAQPGQVADRFRVTGAGGKPERQVPAQVRSGASHGEPGEGQQPAVPAQPSGPRRQRAEEQRGRTGLAGRVRQADPLLVAVQRRPVGQPGGHRGHGAHDAGGDEHPRRAVGSAEQVKQDRRGPAAQRQPYQRGVSGLSERHAVQRVGARAGGQRAHHGVGHRADQGIEGMRALEAFGEGGRPGEQAGPAGLAGPARPLGGGGGLRHP